MQWQPFLIEGMLSPKFLMKVALGYNIMMARLAFFGMLSEIEWEWTLTPQWSLIWKL